MNASAPSSNFSSARYWEARYRNGGHSGAGSYGRLADYKAAFINGFVHSNHINTILDFGCGDGNLLSLLNLAVYTGVDVSPTTLATCIQRFVVKSNHKFRLYDELEPTDRAELTLSIDVIYHLIEDNIFRDYLTALFSRADKFVLIYASNADQSCADDHVRHRRFSDTVSRDFSDWRLAAHLPNPYGYLPHQPDNTSFADFFVYTKLAESQGSLPCILPLPATS